MRNYIPNGRIVFRYGALIPTSEYEKAYEELFTVCAFRHISDGQVMVFSRHKEKVVPFAQGHELAFNAFNDTSPRDVEFVRTMQDVFPDYELEWVVSGVYDTVVTEKV